MTDNKRGQVVADLPPQIDEAAGPERFFRLAAGAPPRPALPAARQQSNYPPPELAGLPVHDFEKWGDPRSECGHELLRVADLVHMLAHRSSSKAVRVVSGHVLDKIEDDNLRTIYVLQPGGEALAIHHDKWLMPDTYPGRQYDPAGSSWCGLVECLRWCWGTDAKGFAALDQGSHAFAAIRLADAVRLFGVAPVVDAQSPVAGPSAASPTESVQDAGRVAPAWQSDARYIAVLRLRNLNGFTRARDTVATEFDVRVRTVGKWKVWVERNEAKDLRERALAKQIQALKAA